ncbi:hypothetical protein [Noviherbaspirillum sp. Root189]|nr:hypothetical protein [Noviherbaspirillum sp. Root189]
MARVMWKGAISFEQAARRTQNGKSRQTLEVGALTYRLHAASK